MPDKSDIYRGQRASELLNDDVFAEALNGVLMLSLTNLADLDATDADAIRKEQATVRVLRSIKDVLEEFIITGSVGNSGSE